MSFTGHPVTLTQAQNLAWMHQQPPPSTAREAVSRLQEALRLCQEALEAGQLVAAQTLLEDAQLQSLVALKVFEIHPEQALQRALARLKAGTAKRAFHIYADRVEVRVGGELRGEWTLCSQHDYEAALRLAHELGCQVVHEEACQLGLFDTLRLERQDAGVAC
ncbi:MAG TPA: hypothetical protein V6C99_03985 [Oculatellaceae cyanobacterium]|jgi:hypothetical protein